MAHVVTHPREPFRTSDGRLEVHQIPTAKDNLTWLLVAPSSGEAAVVDGPDASAVLEYCESRGLSLTTILNTHTHFDHIGINADLEGRGRLGSLRVVGPRRAAKQVPGLTEAVDEGDAVEFAGAKGRVLLTEGHIDGHVSYVFSDVLLCGDTLFGGGCGYLFDGPPSKMFESLRRLSELPPETLVCCAHEYTQDNLRFAWSVEPDNPDLERRIRETWALRAAGGCTLPSTIDLERRTNPFLRWRSATIRQAVSRAMPERALDSDADVFAATRALKDRKDYRALPESSLPLA